MLLQQGERFIASHTADGYFGGARFSGQLHLTNQRLVFEAAVWEPGVGWTTRTLADLHLGQISNLTVSSGQKAGMILRVEAGSRGAYNFTTPHAQNWMHAISRARSESVPPPPPPRDVPPPPPPPQLVVNVPQPQVFLHCRHCGTLNQGGKERCTSCGAAL